MKSTEREKCPTSFTGLPPLWLLCVLGAALLISGCKKDGRKPTIPTIEIRSIDFEGNKTFSSNDLEDYLVSKKRGPYIEARALSDRRIIEDLYRSAGFYDVVVEGPQVKPDRRKRMRLTFTITEGAPVRVTQMDITIATPVKPALKAERIVLLKKGSRADIQKLNESRDRFLHELKERGHALATVRETMEISEKRREAVVRFIVDPGPLCLVGDIHISGLKLIPEKAVSRDLADFKGEKYTPDLEEELERQLATFGVFSMISVTPGVELNKEGKLPVSVLLGESEFQNLKLGFGVGFEPNRQVVRGSGYYTHNNVGGNLNRFSLTLQAGYAVVPAIWDIQDHGPIVLVEPSISHRGFYSRNTWWTITPSFETNIEEDYAYLTPKITPSVTRIFKRRFILRLAYNFQYFHMYNMDSQWAAAILDAEANIQPTFFLATVESSVRLMLTDSMLDPNNGVAMKMTWWIAGKYLGSEVDFNKIQPSITFYWQMLKWLQLAIRGEVGMIFPYGQTTDTGLWMNFFLGGFNTVRGWGGKRLSPREEICATPDDCETVLTGGATMVLGNAELRFRIANNIYLLPFFDVGDVQFKTVTFKPEVWNYTVGLGFRYDSPIGKIRVDGGWRVNNPEPYTDEDRFAIHIGIGEAF